MPVPAIWPLALIEHSEFELDEGGGVGSQKLVFESSNLSDFSRKPPIAKTSESLKVQITKVHPPVPQGIYTAFESSYTAMNGRSRDKCPGLMYVQL
jgi:hypothetical protein